MFGLFGSKKLEVYAPTKGTLIPLDQVKDEVFASKMMGDGFAIEPEDGTIRAPFSGQIIKVFKTKHAILMKTKEGFEAILHIGLGTVELKGQGFDVVIEEGAWVEAKDTLVRVDINLVRTLGKPLTTPVVITNMELVKKMSFTYGPCQAETLIGTIQIV